MPIHDWTRVEEGIFHHFHLNWIFTIARALNSDVLPTGYYALAEQVTAGMESDVITLDRGGESASRRRKQPRR